MTSSRRLPALISGAVALSLVLGGCSIGDFASDLLTSAGKDALAHAALAATVSDLESLDVVEAASYELQADTYLGDIGRLSMTVAANIDGAQLTQLADELRESFDAIEQVAVEPQASVTLAGDTAGKFDLWQLPETNEAVVENFEFWRAASAAVETELWVELLPGPGSSVGMRSIAIAPESDLDEATDRVIDNYAALQRVTLVNDDVENYWQLAGIKSLRELAPLSYVELVSDLRVILPLFSYPLDSDAVRGDSDFPEGFSVSWAPPGGEYGVSGVIVSNNEYTDEALGAAIQAAARTSEIEGVNFQFVAGDREFWMHTTTCSGSVDGTTDDELFFAQLAASGANLSSTAGPGACIP